MQRPTSRVDDPAGLAASRSSWSGQGRYELPVSGGSLDHSARPGHVQELLNLLGPQEVAGAEHRGACCPGPQRLDALRARARGPGGPGGGRRAHQGAEVLYTRTRGAVASGPPSFCRVLRPGATSRSWHAMQGSLLKPIVMGSAWSKVTLYW